MVSDSGTATVQHRTEGEPRPPSEPGISAGGVGTISAQIETGDPIAVESTRTYDGPDHPRPSLRVAFLAPPTGLTAVVMATLALGIGVNVSMFQVLYGLLMRPIPLETEGLMALGMRHASQDVEAYDFSPPDIRDFIELCTGCAEVAAIDGRMVVLTAAEQACRIQAQAVSPELFAVLGVDAAHGRTLATGEDAPDASPRTIRPRIGSGPLPSCPFASGWSAGMPSGCSPRWLGPSYWSC